jgi:hypothetical protein
MGWTCGKYGEKRNTYKFSARRPEAKKPLERTRRTQEDNIKIYVTEIGWDDTGWIHLDQDTEKKRSAAHMVMVLPILYKAGSLSS